MAITATKPEIESRPAVWLDAVVLMAVVALVLGAAKVAAQWRQPLHLSVDIDLSLRALPKYAFFSFVRGWIAYFFSLIFTLLVASWAYYDLRARRYILVALDILQSLPVLAFLFVFQAALVGLFPHSNTGLELACIFAIFTGQVWNMTFSYFDSLRGTPGDFRMLGKLYNFNWWNRFWRIELPFGTQGLLYNSMVSMAGGWFFLTVAEASNIGDKSYRVPGIGSYISVAFDRGDTRACVYAVAAMSVIIVVVDRLIWWPLVVWSRKFKLDDFAGVGIRISRWQLWLVRSLTVQKMAAIFESLSRWLVPPPDRPRRKPPWCRRARLRLNGDVSAGSSILFFWRRSPSFFSGGRNG